MGRKTVILETFNCAVRRGRVLLSSTVTPRGAEVSAT